MKNLKNMMKQLFPAEFFSDYSHARGLVLALLYLGILVSQLFTFEDFPEVVRGYGLPGGQVAVVIVIGLVIFAETAALPFLISMKMRPRWRRVSRAAVIAAPIVWLMLALWMNLYPGSDKANAGLFGATIPTPVQFWLVTFSLLWLWAAVLTIRELPKRAQERP